MNFFFSEEMVISGLHRCIADGLSGLLSLAAGVLGALMWITLLNNF